MVETELSLCNPVYICKAEVKRFPGRLDLGGKERRVQKTPMASTLVDRGCFQLLRWTGKAVGYGLVRDGIPGVC